MESLEFLNIGEVVRCVKYQELETMAFDINTPTENAAQYVQLLIMLREILPFKRHRIKEINTHNLLKLRKDGTINYCEMY